MEIKTVTATCPRGEITLFTLTNAAGASVILSSLGAGIVAVRVPDREGRLADVALGYKNPADYLADGPCMGKIPGRFANRIAKGRFEIDGKTFSLATNNGPNALHGGPEGFQNRIWKCEPTADGIIFSYHAADGEECYPSALDVRAAYTWSDDCRLTLRMTATTDGATVVNLTNHAYFNLDGEDAGSVLDHELRIAATSYLPIDETQIPTGEFAPVADTPMDFRTFKTLGRDIHADFRPLNIGKGYDHCWVVDSYSKGTLREVAELRSPRSGRRLVVATTQPGVQIYTGNWLAGCPESISGGSYADYDGVALECQHFPDSPNKPGFPSTLLRKGETFDETISFHFLAE